MLDVRSCLASRTMESLVISPKRGASKPYLIQYMVGHKLRRLLTNKFNSLSLSLRAFTNSRSLTKQEKENKIDPVTP